MNFWGWNNSIQYGNYRIRGKEYYTNSKLKFEGEYLFNKKLKGKIYDFDGNIVLELNNGNAKIEENNEFIKIYLMKIIMKK